MFKDKEKIVKILENFNKKYDYSKISNISELISILKRTGDALVYNRLRELISNITDPFQLTPLLNEASRFDLIWDTETDICVSNIKKMIFNRLDKILLNVHDFWELIALSREVDLYSNPRNIVRKKIEEILPKKLSTISDLSQLISIWESVDSYSVKELVQQRMEMIISKINKKNFLNNSSNFITLIEKNEILKDLRAIFIVKAKELHMP